MTDERAALDMPIAFKRPERTWVTVPIMPPNISLAWPLNKSIIAAPVPL